MEYYPGEKVVFVDAEAHAKDPIYPKPGTVGEVQDIDPGLGVCIRWLADRLPGYMGLWCQPEQIRTYEPEDD